MRTFFLLVAIIITQCSHAQLFSNISTYTTQDGLSNNNITCIKKDSAGFVWIGTHEGLNRYDGTEFINVLSNQKNNLPSNNITRISFINKSLMVIGTDAGLCFFNTTNFTGKKINLPFNEKYPATGNFIEDVLYKTETKELWVSTWHGLFVLDTTGFVQKKILSQSKDMGHAFANFLFKDDHKNVYFFSPQDNFFYYPDFIANKTIPAENKFPGFALNDMLKEKFTVRNASMIGAEAICVISKSAVEAGDNEYLWYHNIANGKKFLDKINITTGNEKRLASAYSLNDSLFLLNSYFGEPFTYNSNNHEIKRISDQPLWFTSWPDGFGTTICRDQNNIWVGTSKAFLQSSFRTNFFKSDATLVKDISTHKSLVSYNYGIYAFNKLWVACLGAGLFGLDTTSNTVQTVFGEKVPEEYIRKVISTGVIPAADKLWLFSVYGPALVDPQTNKISFIEGVNKNAAFNDYAAYPLTDSKGNIWTSLPTAVSKYSISTNTFTDFKTKYEGGSFPLLRVGPKAEDNHGNIWMIRRDSLVKFDPQKQSFIVFILKAENKILSSVSNMASDGEDILYMSVAGAFGIYHISSGKLELYSKQTGIISTAINDIVSDKEGNAWLATEGGLVFYNRKKMKFSSFTKADGLPDNNIVSLNFTDDSKQILFLGFEKTYSLFEPHNFLLEKSVPQNVITGIEINGAFVDKDKDSVFSYKDNSISFTYTGINYNQGQQNNYACMLVGFDKGWKYPGTERKVNYINLPPGDYTFKVKSANHQGEWNESPAAFRFVIRPPFWQRWWFRGLVICLVVFSIYYFIKSREAALQKENKVKLQMSELRMQALRAQMNPHFIFNSLNSIQNYILSNNTIDAAGYLSKFAKLMRRILDQSKHNFIPLGEVLETLKMYVEIEAFRFNNEIKYSFDIEEDDDLLDARVPPMLLQPFVENAILHGLMPKNGEKFLRISSRIINNSIEIIIDDNGIGRIHQQPKAGHESQGEKLTAGMLESLQQIQNIKASFAIIDKKENNVPAGTTVQFLLPLK